MDSRYKVADNTPVVSGAHILPEETPGELNSEVLIGKASDIIQEGFKHHLSKD